jgi:hypothetical protein
MTHAEQLRQHAAELLRIADELDRASVFPSLLSKAARRLCVKEAAEVAGLSTRQTYRLATVLGERVNGRWKIDESRLLEAMARRGEAMANDGEQACFGAGANQGSSQGRDKA